MVNTPGNGRGDSGSSYEAPAFEPIEAFSWAFAVLRTEPQRIGLPLILAAFVGVLAGTVIPSVLSGLARLVTSAAPDSLGAVLFLGFVRFLGAALSLVVWAALSTIVVPFAVNVARGKLSGLVDRDRIERTFSRSLGLLLVVACATSIGSAICVLPGFVVVVGTVMAMPLMLDLDTSIVAALRGSYELARTNLGPLAVFCALGFALLLVGTLLCFVGAVLVSIPAVLLAQAYVYLRLQGETPVTV